MSSATAQRWQLLREAPEGAACVLCESGAPLVDTRIELASGERLYICADCAESLAVAHRIESKATAAVLEQAERESAAREQMLSARDTELAEQRRQIETLNSELERMREEQNRRAFALNRIVAAAQELL